MGLQELPHCHPAAIGGLLGHVGVGEVHGAGDFLHPGVEHVKLEAIGSNRNSSSKILIQ